MSTSHSPAKIIMLGVFPPDVHQNVHVPLCQLTVCQEQIFSLAQRGLAGGMESARTALAVWSSMQGK